jgi:glutaredoxin-like protein NrdH
MTEFARVEGKDRGTVVLYALSTCAWCRRTRQMLDSLGIGYEYVYVDLLGSKEQDEAMAEMRRWNPGCSFPTIVVDSREVIRGFDEARIRELLG